MHGKLLACTSTKPKYMEDLIDQELRDALGEEEIEFDLGLVSDTRLDQLAEDLDSNPGDLDIFPADDGILTDGECIDTYLQETTDSQPESQDIYIDAYDIEQFLDMLDGVSIDADAEVDVYDIQQDSQAVDTAADTGVDTGIEPEVYKEVYLDAYDAQFDAEICWDISVETYMDSGPDVQDVSDAAGGLEYIENIAAGFLMLAGYTDISEEEIKPKSGFISSLAAEDPIPPQYASADPYQDEGEVPEEIWIDGIKLCNFTYALGEDGCTNEAVPIGGADYLDNPVVTINEPDWIQSAWEYRQSEYPDSLAALVINYYGQDSYEIGLTIFSEPVADPWSQKPGCSYLFNTYACSISRGYELFLDRKGWDRFVSRGLRTYFFGLW